jgi:hypothetical protein
MPITPAHVPMQRIPRTGRPADPNYLRRPTATPQMGTLLHQLSHLRDVRTARLRAIEQLQRQIDHVVVQARGNGASWPELGRALGLSPKAAWKRYVV